MANYGFVYILDNPSMPNVFKIGYTDRAPLKRAEELSNSTSIPTSFRVVFYIECEEPQSVESDLHQEFSEQRISSNREFFRFKISQLIEDVIPSMKDCCIHSCQGMEYADYMHIHHMQKSAAEEKETKKIEDKSK